MALNWLGSIIKCQRLTLPNCSLSNRPFQGNIDVPLRNEAGTGELLAIPLVGLISSLLIFWLVRSTTRLSMIKKYHRTITESSANGFINISVFIVIIIIYLFFIVNSIMGNVSTILTNALVLKPIFLGFSQPVCKASWCPRRRMCSW